MKGTLNRFDAVQVEPLCDAQYKCLLECSGGFPAFVEAHA
jgi:hypothetical protein